MSKARWKVWMAADDTLELLIYDVIGQTWDGEGVSAKQIAKTLEEHKGVKNIHVAINSPGGYVFEAMAIVNQLQRHAARVTVDIDGAALSAASVVAMAGDEIRMAENALLMIHDPIGLTIGTAADHAKAVVELEKVKDVIVATYAARSGMDEERAARLMADETWLTAEEALEEGLVDKVTEAKRMAAFGGSAAELLLGSYRHKPADLGVATDEDDAEAAAAEAGDGGEQETVVMSTKPKEQAAAPAGPEQPAVATAAALREKFPQATAEQREQWLVENLTVDQAQARWTKHVTDEHAARGQEIEKLRAENKAQADQICDLTAKLEGGSGTGEAVEHSPEPKNSGSATTPEGWKAEYEQSPALQKEFGKVEAYIAYRKAEASGQARILNAGGSR